jgi:hypothetical protein
MARPETTPRERQATTCRRPDSETYRRGQGVPVACEHAGAASRTRESRAADTADGSAHRAVTARLAQGLTLAGVLVDAPFPSGVRAQSGIRLLPRATSFR